ncbi:nucleoside-diphosphate-sugar epimerase [Bacteroidia bacterium]|nr:nucleoside-diphosphate-sugar epimerase [Bacteroidia bacterium]
MNILITGIHGFVGTNLVAALKTNHTIYGLDIVFPKVEGVVKTFSWDDLAGVSNLTNLAEVDVIIHLAGKAHDVKNKSLAQTYFDINVGLTQRIFEFFLNSSTARKFIFFSSVAAAATDLADGILTEDIIPLPFGPYGESKRLAEQYILKEMAGHAAILHSKQICNDKGVAQSVYILRPAMIHGPGNKGNFNLLYQVVKRGIPWPLGSFENRRSFTSIDNLVFIINGLLVQNIQSGIYHVADEESLSTNELIGLICTSLGRKPRIWRLNKSLMTRMAQIGGFLHLPLNSKRLRKLTENYVVSNEKIKRALGIEKLPLTAKEGFVRTLESF